MLKAVEQFAGKMPSPALLFLSGSIVLCLFCTGNNVAVANAEVFTAKDVSVVQMAMFSNIRVCLDVCATQNKFSQGRIEEFFKYYIVKETKEIKYLVGGACCQCYEPFSTSKKTGNCLGHIETAKQQVLAGYMLSQGLYAAFCREDGCKAYCEKLHFDTSLCVPPRFNSHPFRNSPATNCLCSDFKKPQGFSTDALTVNYIYEYPPYHFVDYCALKPSGW